MRFFASISYNGSGYSGWQIQDNAPSIQNEVQKALSAILGEKIDVTGAGRTDTGVNASDFTAHFDSDDDRIIKEHGKIIYKINAILPANIVVNSITRVREDAHARFDAVSRTYKYYIHSSKDPFAPHFSWYCKFPLDIRAMNAAASLLTGKKDFSCFEKTGGSQVSPICDISTAYWDTYTPSITALPGTDYLVFTITANRFLRNMVRAIVGTMVEIGRGRHTPEWMEEVLSSRDRGQAGQSVPGHALFLTNVRYPEDIFKLQ
ncbi:MAG TPA: tRNA pseudouridine(38-40) synthase TruA [Candidatus Coprenecus stercoravium]|uniref:tRNA pseudouridine synthase A n=1 Tax=Candidatus Coprenecus stercoravium TaxID=2840735 RepID=A0A9D2GN01_9BACT|nr:tRNA pseudouridine(38-40) synthase TruA [Candidatus Coprenecus stercoravium]